VTFCAIVVSSVANSSWLGLVAHLSALEVLNKSWLRLWALWRLKKALKKMKEYYCFILFIKYYALWRVGSTICHQTLCWWISACIMHPKSEAFLKPQLNNAKQRRALKFFLSTISQKLKWSSKLLRLVFNSKATANISSAQFPSVVCEEGTSAQNLNTVSKSKWNRSLQISYSSFVHSSSCSRHLLVSCLVQ
jgi:hypothetical protein